MNNNDSGFCFLLLMLVCILYMLDIELQKEEKLIPTPTANIKPKSWTTTRPLGVERLHITHTGVRDINISVPTQPYLAILTKHCETKEPSERRFCTNRLKRISVATGNADWVIDPLYGRPPLSLVDIDFALRESQAAVWAMEEMERDPS